MVNIRFSHSKVIVHGGLIEFQRFIEVFNRQVQFALHTSRSTTFHISDSPVWSQFNGFAVAQDGAGEVVFRGEQLAALDLQGGGVRFLRTRGRGRAANQTSQE